MRFSHIHETDVHKHFADVERHTREVGHAAVKREVRAAVEIYSLLGDSWSMPILVTLGAGPKRFNDIRRVLDDISQRMLTRALRRMERDGLVGRTVLDTTPPGVVYALTPLGRSLCVPADALAQWAFRHLTEIENAQRKFDRTRGVAPVATPD